MKHTNKKKTKNNTPKPNKQSPLLRLFQAIGRMLSRLMSTFRFSLTLRIAVHSSLQLIRTALMFLIIFSITYTIAQFPVIKPHVRYHRHHDARRRQIPLPANSCCICP